MLTDVPSESSGGLMGLISKIALKNDYVFPENGIEIKNCNVINFIYGPNGSGKSTISGFLREQEASGAILAGVTWAGPCCSVHVYNREWREENFRDRNDLPGVFALGSDSIQAREKIDDLKEELEKCLGKINRAKESKENKKAELEESLKNFESNAWTNVLKFHEDAFGPGLSGHRGSRTKFAKRLLEQADCSPKYEKAELSTRVKEIFSDTPEELSLLDTEVFTHSEATIKAFEECALWEKAITGNQDVDIAKLIARLGNSDWVSSGRTYIGESNKCPFCQQDTLTDDFKTQIELFFDEEFKADLKNIELLEQSFVDVSDRYLGSATSALTTLNEMNIDSIIPDQIELAIQDIADHKTTVVGLIKDKVSEPGRRILIPKFEDLHKSFISLIESANNTIKTHNQTIKNIQEEKSRLKNQIWAYLRKDAEALVQSYGDTKKRADNAIKGLQKTINEQNEKKTDIEAKLIIAQKEVTSVQSAVDEINRLLHAYGFDGFSISRSKTDSDCYEIIRPDGAPVNRTLSEGEETFIAFLYFMQTIEGISSPDEVSGDKVIVIDDPICSLDSTILYIVSSMIKALIERAKTGEDPIQQVFILTHNVFFHKEASFMAGRPKEDRKVSYWTLSKNGTTSTIKSHGPTNTIKTAYELLWQELKDENASVVTLQNTMRRIIENYFGMLGKNKHTDIESAFETNEEKLICRSLFAWMNDGSHSIPDDLYIDSYSDSPEKYKEVFKTIFVNTKNEEHYNMMMGCSQLINSEN